MIAGSLALAAPPHAAALLLLGGALSAVVASVLLVVRARRRRAGSTFVGQRGSGPMTCPSCMREFPAGTVFCPLDARKLVAAEEVGERRSAGVRCQRCRRAFESATRYCPFDAEELVPQAVFDASHPSEPPEHVHGEDLLTPDGGKICPTCAAKYGLDATFCGKDGSELVSVN